MKVIIYTYVLMENYRFDKFKVENLQDLPRKLNKYGVAIVPNVLDKKEIKDMQDGAWNTLEYLTKNFEVPIDRTNSTTFRSYRGLLPMHSMLYQHWKIGHAQYVWNVRQNPKIVNIFSTIWNCDNSDLVTSFDGVAFHFPPEITRLGWYRKEWFHTDQSFTNPEFECVQGWVTAYDINPGDASLTILEKSHKYHKEFQEEFRITKKANWYKLNDEERSFYTNKGCNKRTIECPAGSVVLWDSRTIHCGQEAMKQRTSPNFRNIVYVCMTKRDRCTPNSIRKRIKFFETMRMTTHWPHTPRLFGLKPQTWGKPLPNVPDLTSPELTELGRSLVGY